MSAKINGVNSGASYAFMALATSASNVTGDGTTFFPVVYGTIVRNDGNCYNESTGYFTAPITGWYHFSESIYVNGITSNQSGIQLGFYHVGVTYYWQTVYESKYVASAGADLIMNGSIDIYLTANQQVCVSLLCYGTTKVVDIVAGHGTFSGFFIG